MAYVLTIAGSTKSINAASLHIREALNARSTFEAEILSLAGSYRPAPDDDVVLTESGTRIFGGLVGAISEVGFADVGRTAIINRITADDYSVYASWRYVTASYATQSLKSLLTSLVASYLTTYGVTLDAAQVTGPTLPALTYSSKILSELLNDLTTQTGYLWRIDYNKALRMYAPGDIAAPYSITTANGKALGDIQVQNSRQGANKILLQAGSTSVVQKVDTFTGNGATTTFTLTYPLAAATSISGWAIDDLTVAGQEELVDVGPTPQWTYNSSTNQITRTAGAPGVGQAIVVTYGAQFPITVTSGSPATPREKLLAAPDVYDKTQAQAMADGALAEESVSAPQEATYLTQQTGLAVGNAQTVTVAERNLSGTFIVQSIDTSDLGTVLNRVVHVVKGTQFTGNWQRDYAALTGGGGSSAAAVTTSGQFSSTPVLNGWNEDDQGGTIVPAWVPVNDNAQQLGLTTRRIERVIVGSSSTGGYQWRGASSDFARITLATHPTLPQLLFAVINGSSVGGTVATFYKEGIDAIFRAGALGAGLRILDASEAYKLLISLTKTLTADRTASLNIPDAAFDLNFGAWTSYTPTWSATGTAPVIGNGSLTGKYSRVGKRVVFKIILSAGTTTTFGTGNWKFTTPSNMPASGIDQPVFVNAIGFDVSAGAPYSGQAWKDAGSQTTVVVYQPGTSNLFGPTVPFTWDAATADQMHIQGCYEEA